jgi:O-acetyl-ADP-ribose deacetylase
MMRWRVQQGDILDEPADVLICSANPFLTLSGGVGGALLLRYGASLQQELNDALARQRRKFADRGSVIVTTPAHTPYRAILHAVAVDGFYESSPEIVAGVVRAALREAARRGARTIALAALATGYGKLTIGEFGRRLAGLIDEEVPPISAVTVVVRGAGDATELARAVPGIEVV